MKRIYFVFVIFISLIVSPVLFAEDYTEKYNEININFQPVKIITPEGYLKDYGLIFSEKNGYSYGWNIDHKSMVYKANVNSDPLLDTNCRFKKGGKWELAVPVGKYKVTVTIGDAGYKSIYSIRVEGIYFWKELSLNKNKFLTKTQTVNVEDGRITIDQANLGNGSTRITNIRVCRIKEKEQLPLVVPAKENVFTHTAYSFISRKDLIIKGTTEIDTQQAFMNYTNKKGIYGVLYSEKPVEIFAETDGKPDIQNKVQGSGIVEYGFPNAKKLFICAQNAKVYLFALPVPYYSWSPKGNTKVSLPEEYACKIDNGKYNGFILCKTPHMLFDDGWWAIEGAADNVLWQTSLIAPLADEYKPFEGDGVPEWCYRGQFLSDNPILLQVTGFRIESFNKLPIEAREMKKIVSNGRYEYWNMLDYTFTNVSIENDMLELLNNSIDFALTNYFPENMKMNKVIVCGLDQKMAKSAGAATVDYNARVKGFYNMIMFDNEYLNGSSKQSLADVVAHETAHIVDKNCFAVPQKVMYSWFDEGFAMIFANELQKSLGYPVTQPYEIDDKYYKYISNMEKFLYTKWENARKILDAEKTWENAVLGGTTQNEYWIGLNFMSYIQEKYGLGVIKKHFESFGSSVKNRVQNSDNNYNDSYGQIWFNVDFECWDNLKKLTSPNLYKEFKEWYDKKYGIA